MVIKLIHKLISTTTFTLRKIKSVTTVFAGNEETRNTVLISKWTYLKLIQRGLFGCIVTSGKNRVSFQLLKVCDKKQSILSSDHAFNR